MNLSDLLRLLPQGQAEQAPIPRAAQRPPVIGPGGVTSPDFIPREVMQNYRRAPAPPINPELRRGPFHASPLVIAPPGPVTAPPFRDAYTEAPTGRFAPPRATQELSSDYVATRPQWSGPIPPEAPGHAFRPAQDSNDDDNAAWNEALARVRAQMATETQNAARRVPRAGAPAISQAWAEPLARKSMRPPINYPRIYRNPTAPTGDGRWRTGG